MSTRPKIPRNVIIIAFVALASGFGQDLITPVLPAYLAMLGVSTAGIGLADGLLQGAMSIFRFASGILSDRYRNRKFFVFLGYALSSVSRPLLALVGGLPAIAFLRTIDGVGKGMKDAPRDALVADSAEAGIRGRAFGFQRLIDTLGSVLGPLTAAGVLILLSVSIKSYHIIFAIAAIPGVIALALIWFGIKEKQSTRYEVRGTAMAHLGWRFWFFAIGMSLAMLTKINDSLFLVRAHDIGVSIQWIPVLFAGFTLLYALLSYPLGILSDRIGKAPLIAAGWLVLAIVEFGFSFDPNIAATLVLFALYGLFYALTEGSGRAIIADLAPVQNRGTAYGIYYTLIGLAVIIGGYALGRVWDSMSPETAFRISAVGSLLGFLVLSALAGMGGKRKTAVI
ncbi:MFS transporter [Candidatus Uhrbacteria bacterium]|nr:MFS transporter [Candidatus Uhrbacteria bacterium]